nr:MAG TPA: hypothetical protein [Caudoviricetes sp.]
MSKHTRNRQTFIQRPCPIGLTPFLGGVANRRIQQRPGPFSGQVYSTKSAALCQSSPPGWAAFQLVSAVVLVVVRHGLGLILAGPVLSVDVPQSALHHFLAVILGPVVHHILFGDVLVDFLLPCHCAGEGVHGGPPGRLNGSGNKAFLHLFLRPAASRVLVRVQRKVRASLFQLRVGFLHRDLTGLVLLHDVVDGLVHDRYFLSKFPAVPVDNKLLIREQSSLEPQAPLLSKWRKAPQQPLCF